ncbi:MAG: hypothetical protein ACHQK8_07485 [Bacteroidia bacterium]
MKNQKKINNLASLLEEKQRLQNELGMQEKAMLNHVVYLRHNFIPLIIYRVIPLKGLAEQGILKTVTADILPLIFGLGNESSHSEVSILLARGIRFVIKNAGVNVLRKIFGKKKRKEKKEAEKN